jgi:hypothetical protein
MGNHRDIDVPSQFTDTDAKETYLESDSEDGEPGSGLGSEIREEFEAESQASSSSLKGLIGIGLGAQESTICRAHDATTY